MHVVRALSLLAVGVSAAGLVPAPAFAAPAESTVDVAARTDRPAYRTGDTVSVTVAVRNTGAADTTNLKLVLANDLGSTFAVGGGTGWDCYGAAELVCERPTLAAGATSTLAISGVPKRVGSFTSALKLTHGANGKGPVTGATSIAFSVANKPGKGSISGHLYEDTNGNGRYDPGKDQGAWMYTNLSRPGGPYLGQMGSNDGFYQFADLEPGQYKLSGERVPMPGFNEGRFARDVTIVADTDTVVDVIAPPSVPWYLPSSSPPVRPAPAPGLPITGAQVGLIAGAGAALLAAGALLLVLGRRRRSATEG
jgi:hypothetical protein